MSEILIYREAQRSRQTAMEAERHFWVKRLTALAASWREEHVSNPWDTVDRRELYEACADEIHALIAERTK